MYKCKGKLSWSGPFSTFMIVEGKVSDYPSPTSSKLHPISNTVSYPVNVIHKHFETVRNPDLVVNEIFHHGRPHKSPQSY